MNTVGRCGDAMETKRDRSLVMAERLKTLRLNKGLTHEGLSKVLQETCHVSISADSLKIYEIDKPEHSKARKNEGMRAEYVRALAMLYGVSADYLLGIGDEPSRKTPATEDLHLSQISVDWIEEMQRNYANGRSFDLNLFFHSREVQDFFNELNSYLATAVAVEIFERLQHKYWQQKRLDYDRINQMIFEDVQQIVQSGRYSSLVNSKLYSMAIYQMLKDEQHRYYLEELPVERDLYDLASHRVEKSYHKMVEALKKRVTATDYLQVNDCRVRIQKSYDSKGEFFEIMVSREKGLDRKDASNSRVWRPEPGMTERQIKKALTQIVEEMSRSLIG